MDTNRKIQIYRKYVNIIVSAKFGNQAKVIEVNACSMLHINVFTLLISKRDNWSAMSC